MYCETCKYFRKSKCSNVDSDYFGCGVISRNWCNEFEKGEDNMEIKVMLDEGIKMPTKAHDADAGFDIYSPKKLIIYGRGNCIVNTGVHFQIPKGYVGFIKSKSGLNMKSGITVEGVIDSGYTGSVVLKLYNNSNDYITIEEGQKLTQIVFLPIPDVELKLTDKFEETERGNGGFGSTGKF